MNFINNLSRDDKYLALVLFAVLILRVLVLGAYPLMDTTEARYAEIAREMLATHNWITPQLDPGSPFWGKPPLSFWATALSFKLFAVSEFTARLPSLLFALGNMLLVFILAKKLVSVTFALQTSVILATTGLFYFMAGGVMTDPALLFSVTISMVSFLLALNDGSGRPWPYWRYLFFVGLGLSFLSKGPIGIVLTLFPLFLWIIYKKKWRGVIRVFPWCAGLLLMLAIALPWHIIAEIKTPGFLEYYFIGEHFKRFVVTGWQGDLYGSAHSQPRGMIWLFLIPATLPWIVYFVANIQLIVRKAEITDFFSSKDWISYCVFWFLTPMIFFTFAGNILMTYVLPALPPFAILTAYSLQFNKKTNITSSSRWYVNCKTFLIFSFSIPVLFTIISFTVLQGVGMQRSHKAIGQFFVQNAQADSRLIYVGKMPYSADFYSNGKGVALKNKLNFKEMSEYLLDDRMDFYAISKDQEKQIPGNIKSMIFRVKDFGKYSLFQENKRVP